LKKSQKQLLKEEYEREQILLRKDQKKLAYIEKQVKRQLSTIWSMYDVMFCRLRQRLSRLR
jgi:hypothetical protein